MNSWLRILVVSFGVSAGLLKAQGAEEEVVQQIRSSNRVDLKAIAYLLKALHDRMDKMEDSMKAVVTALGDCSEGDSIVNALRGIKNSVDDIEGTVAVARNESSSSNNFMKQAATVARELLGGNLEDIIGAFLKKND